MKRFTTKMLCRAGVIAALYTVLTWPLGSLAFGAIGFQIRPAEALTMLPFFFPESIPALFVGCFLANLLLGYSVWDMTLGPLASLAAAILTWLTGKLIKNTPVKPIVGGLFPVLINAFVVPLIFILTGSTTAGYWFYFASLTLTQAVWVYGLGVPLYFAVRSLRRRGVSVFLDNTTGEQLEKNALSEHKN